ncbi:MAG: ArsR family transcriptional regulator [Xanthomonadales bacterium]|nr:ArsR family transcriptional regulator [Xanthomonadales bacterium]
MSAAAGISGIAVLLGEPARARMVESLMDGRARTATELALEAGVAPSTASVHLERLRDGGLVSLLRQGRHRYFVISDPAVAHLIEGLLGLSVSLHPARLLGSTDPQLRAARVCYDHLAGTLGVRIAQQLEARGYLLRAEGGPRLSARGCEWLADSGLAVPQGCKQALRDCLDWTERRMHLAGGVATVLLQRWTTLGWLVQEPTGRALRVSPRAEQRMLALALR